MHCSAAKKWGCVKIVSQDWVARSLQQGWPVDEAQWPARRAERLQMAWQRRKLRAC